VVFGMGWQGGVAWQWHGMAVDVVVFGWHGPNVHKGRQWHSGRF